MTQSQQQHRHWMQKALKMARAAALKGEVPVAALVVSPEGQLLASATNVRETKQTPLGHAELLALHRASQKLQSWRLEGCTLYVTLEPCIMCAGAIQQSRISQVVYGASDPKAGAVDSLYQVLSDSRLNHQCQVISGVESTKSAEMISSFFQSRRQENKSQQQDLIYRPRAEALIVHNNKYLVVQLQDPISGNTFFTLPGGGVESSESPAQTALREVREETGYNALLVPGLTVEKKSIFHWMQKDRPVHTTYFLGKLKDPQAQPQVVKDAPYNKGCFWFTKDELLQHWADYPTALAAIQKLLKKTHLLKEL